MVMLRYLKILEHSAYGVKFPVAFFSRGLECVALIYLHARIYLLTYVYVVKFKYMFMFRHQNE
jgi:hypothetical protein